MAKYYTEISFTPTKAKPTAVFINELSRIIKRQPSDNHQDYGRTAAIMYDFKQLPALRKAIGRLRESGLRLRIYTAEESGDFADYKNFLIPELSNTSGNAFFRAVEGHERQRNKTPKKSSKKQT